jgi:hypothetical protein
MDELSSSEGFEPANNLWFAIGMRSTASNGGSVYNAPGAIWRNHDRIYLLLLCNVTFLDSHKIRLDRTEQLLGGHSVHDAEYAAAAAAALHDQRDPDGAERPGRNLSRWDIAVGMLGCAKTPSLPPRSPPPNSRERRVSSFSTWGLNREPGCGLPFVLADSSSPLNDHSGVVFSYICTDRRAGPRISASWAL